MLPFLADDSSLSWKSLVTTAITFCPAVGHLVTPPCYESGFVPPGTAQALPFQGCASLRLEKKAQTFCAGSSPPPPDSGMALGLLEAL